MKIEKFLNNIEEFFRANKKEINKLEDALKKLQEKQEKLLKRLKNKDFLKKEDYQQSLRNKLKMVKELKKKIKKKIQKELNKLNLEKSIK